MMIVEVTEFIGWSQNTTVSNHPVSTPSDGQAVFQMEVNRALNDNMDVERVTLIDADGHIARSIVFNDRLMARQD